MKHRMLGKSLEVSKLGLGCMPMSGTSEAGGSLVYGAANEDEAIATIHRALDLGVTFFDSAEAYGPFTNEMLIGRAIKGRSENIVLATKFGFSVVDGKLDHSRLDGSPARARAACEGALKRLGVEAIDLFYPHRVDPNIPIEEMVGGMADLVREGKVRHIGLCEAAAKTIRRAQAVHPLAAVQSEYSLWERGIETEILPTLRELGIGFVPFAPLGRGFLTGGTPSSDKMEKGDIRHFDPRHLPENHAANMRVVEAVKAVAGRHEVSPARVAIAWLLQQGEDIVPIPGAKRRATMEDSIAAVDLRLTEDDMEQLETAAPVGGTAGDRYVPAGMKTVRI